MSKFCADHPEVNTEFFPCPKCVLKKDELAYEITEDSPIILLEPDVSDDLFIGERAKDERGEPPILIGVPFLRDMAKMNPDAFPEFVIKFAERAEEHNAHLEALLATQGIVCTCTSDTADQQCLIHVHENLPDD